MRDLGERGYVVLRDVVPPPAVDAALRHIHVGWARLGTTVDQLSEYIWNATWFPQLRWDPPIVALAEYLPPELRDGELCDPQLVLGFPHEGPEPELTSHVDSTPAWSNGRPYKHIVGVALTRAAAENGALHVWPFGHDEPEPVELDAGDVVVMHPQLAHTGGPNLRGSIRYAVYFRYLEPE